MPHKAGTEAGPRFCPRSPDDFKPCPSLSPILSSAQTGDAEYSCLHLPKMATKCLLPLGVEG